MHDDEPGPINAPLERTRLPWFVSASWPAPDSVQHSVRNFSDGENVVLHEFAHQLDHESGITNGAPLLYLNSLLNVSFALNMGDFAKKHGIGRGGDWNVRLHKIAPAAAGRAP